jgi:tetratricopeptide (TPR) repeat protein
MRRIAATTVLACVLAAVSLPSVTCTVFGQSAENDGAREQFVFAYKLYKAGDDKLAAESFDEFIAKNPSDARVQDALYFRSILARKFGKTQEAVDLVNKVEKPTLIGETSVLLLKGQLYVDLKDYDHALPWLEKVALDKAAPGDKAGALYLQGVCYRETGNVQAASAAFQKCAEIDSPLKSRCLLELGLTYRTAKQPAEAIKVLEQAVASQDPGVVPGAARVAGDISRVEFKKYDQAQKFYDVVIKSFQSSEEFGPAVVGSLWCHLAVGENNVLLTKAARLADNLKPSDKQTAQYLSALAHQAMGEQEEGVKILTGLDKEQLSPELRPLVRYYLAVGQIELGDQAGFDKTVKSYATDFPDSSKGNAVLMLQVQSKLKAKDVPGAAAVLTGVIEQQPAAPIGDRLEALKRRAELYESAGNPVAGADDYGAWGKLAATAPKGTLSDPTEPSRLALRRSDLLVQVNKNAQAVDVLKEIVASTDVDPVVDQESRFLLAICLGRLDKPQEAADTLSALLAKHAQAKRLSEIRYNRGLFLMAAEKPDEALPDLLLAGAAKDLPMAQRVEAYRLAGLRLRQLDKKDEAGAILKTLSQMGELKADEALWLARLMIEKGQGKDAVTVLDPFVKRDAKALSEIETRAEAQYLTGIAKRINGELEVSIALLTGVLDSEATPNLKLEARLELARSLADRGRTVDAIKQYEMLISAKPSHIAATAAFDCATLYRALGRGKRADIAGSGSPENMKQAEKLFKRVVLLYSFPQLSPLPEKAWIELAELAQEQGKLDEAIKSYQTLGEKYGNSPYGLYGKAMVLAVVKKNKIDAAQTLRQIPQPVEPTLFARINQRLREWEGTAK